MNHLKMTVLVDNTAKPLFLCEWGLSILIDADDTRILLDTGSSGMFAENAKQLGIDLASVRIGVLSHAHYDHSDGLDTFFSLNETSPFLIRAGSEENCFAGGSWLVPHRPADYSAIAQRNDLYLQRGKAYIPDSFSHEQSLVIDTAAGLAVFSSCSHTGMTNILEDIRLALGRDDIFAYIGGLHLYKLTDPELDDLCDEIEQSAVARIFTGHCTGDHAYQYLKDRLGDRIVQFSSGFIHEIL